MAIKAKRKAQRQASTQAPAERPLNPQPAPPGKDIHSRPVQQPNVTHARVETQPQHIAVDTNHVSNGSMAEQDTATVRSSQPNTKTSVTATVKGTDGASALPKGFFDDKKSDAIAQGEKPKTAADAEKELEAFQKEMNQLEEQQIAVAAEEASEAAKRAAAQEELENKCASECRDSCDVYSSKKSCTMCCVWPQTVTHGMVNTTMECAF